MLKVNASATPNAQPHGAYQPPNVSTGENVAATATTTPAAILDISARGRDLAALQLRKSDEPVIFISDEEAENIRAEMAKYLSAPPDPATMIHTAGMDGTLQKIVADVVNAKMDPTTASKFTQELDRLIGGAYENGKLSGTIEERTVNREKGLKLAEYIAENYIDSPADRQKFLDGVKQFADYAELREKGYDVLETPDGARISRPGQSAIPGESPTNIPGYDKAWDEAVKSLGVHDDSLALLNEAARIFLRDAPAGKYDSIAKMFAAGEINGVGVVFRVLSAQREAGYAAPSPSANALAEKEREAGDAIAKAKSNLDKNALMEDVRDMIKKITANFVSYDDYMKNLQRIINSRNGITTN